MLEGHGIPTVVIEPGRDVLAHVSNDFMDQSQVIDIVRESFMDTGAQILDDALLRQLRPTERVSADGRLGRSAS